MALRLRRGTEAERQLITPLQGELIYATDTKQLYVGDGAAVGGILVGPIANNLVNDLTPQLGGDLDLNSNNITGVGNINIDGTITATGNIGLGDADDDSITVGGVINSSLRPAQTQAYTLGTENRQWQHVYTGGATIDQQLTVESIALQGNIVNEANSSTIYNSTTDTLTATSFEGDFKGSLFGDDSTILVDAVNSQISNGTLTLAGQTISTVIGDEIVLESNNVVQHRYGIDGNPDNMAYLSILGGRGTKDAPLSVQVGDFPSSLSMQAYNGSGVETKTLVTTQIDTVTGTNTLPGKLIFTVHDFDGNYSSYGSLDSRGTFEMPTFKATPYADIAARDAAIPTASAGMIIYLTATNKLQCYNGTAWTDLF